MHCLKEGRVLAFTEVDILRFAPMDWSTLTNNVLGFMYLFPEGARELKVKPGRSGADHGHAEGLAHA